MALTSTTIFDISAQSQTLNFTNPNQIDQISYSGNQIIFSSSKTYTLLKSDVILWFKYLNAFNSLLLSNFPSIYANAGQAIPVCSFSMSSSQSNSEKKLVFDQQWSGIEVLNINYSSLSASAIYSTRANPIKISLQEFSMTVLMMSQFITQISLN